MRGPDSNFLPNIRCPFCGRVGPYAISGFAGELSLREKLCPKCRREFVMIVYACSSLPGAEVDTDDALASLKERIKWLRRQRRKARGLLLLEREAAERIYTESLVQASRERRKRGEN